MVVKKIKYRRKKLAQISAEVAKVTIAPEIIVNRLKHISQLSRQQTFELLSPAKSQPNPSLCQIFGKYFSKTGLLSQTESGYGRSNIPQK